MNYDKYYEARDIVTEILKKDLLGPVTEDEIICKDRPLDYYQIGKLYPQLRDAVAIPVEGTPSEELGELDEEDAISLSNGRNPSSCGITFCIGEDCSSFIVDIDAARYEVIPFSEAMEKVPFKKDDFDEKDTFWKRVRLQGDNLHLIIEMSEMIPGKILSKKIEEGLLLKILLHRTYHEQYRTITVSLVNEKDKDAEFDYIAECENAYFQPCISISLEDNHHFKDVRMNANTYTDEELLELEMLYSDACVYASGHGCAVDWGTMEGVCKQIRTSFLPVYEVRQMMPSTAFSGDVLCMKYLSEASAVSIINGFQILLDNYREWIEKQRQTIAKRMKLTPSMFSMNVKGGRCECCQGTGLQKIELNYLPSSYITCPECGGKRFNEKILAVEYCGKNIYDILETPISDIIDIFKGTKKVFSVLNSMMELGLGYLKLGQMSMNLSGGEAQRVKLAKALGTTSNGKNLYILDEPTSGLNNVDIERFSKILISLQAKKDTIMLIEHNIEFIAGIADYIIDFGVFGGEAGGKIIAQGSPEIVFAQKESSLYKLDKIPVGIHD